MPGGAGQHARRAFPRRAPRPLLSAAGRRGVAHGRRGSRSRTGSMTRSNVPGMADRGPAEAALEEAEAFPGLRHGGVVALTNPPQVQRARARVPMGAQERRHHRIGPALASEILVACRSGVEVPGAIPGARCHGAGEQPAVVLGKREEPVAVCGSVSSASVPRKSRDRARNACRSEVSSSRPWNASSASPSGSRRTRVVTPSRSARRSSARASFDHSAMGSAGWPPAR